MFYLQVFQQKIRVSFTYYLPCFCYIVDIIKTVFYHVSRIVFCFFTPSFTLFSTLINNRYKHNLKNTELIETNNINITYKSIEYIYLDIYIERY